MSVSLRPSARAAGALADYESAALTAELPARRAESRTRPARWSTDGRRASISTPSYGLLGRRPATSLDRRRRAGTVLPSVEDEHCRAALLLFGQGKGGSSRGSARCLAGAVVIWAARCVSFSSARNVFREFAAASGEERTPCES